MSQVLMQAPIGVLSGLGANGKTFYARTDSTRQAMVDTDSVASLQSAGWVLLDNPASDSVQLQRNAAGGPSGPTFDSVTGKLIPESMMSRLRRIIAGSPIVGGNGFSYMATPPGVLFANAPANDVGEITSGSNGGSLYGGNAAAMSTQPQYFGRPQSDVPGNNNGGDSTNCIFVLNEANALDQGMAQTFDSQRKCGFTNPQHPATAGFTSSGTWPVQGFIHNGRILALYVGTGQTLNLLVDGQIAWPQMIVHPKGGLVLIDFGTRKRRKIISWSARSAQHAGFAARDVSDELSLFNFQSGNFTFAMMWDSYAQQQQTLSGHTSIPMAIGVLLGTYAAYDCAIGGTGIAEFGQSYLNPALPPYSNAGRIAALVANNPDVIFIPGSTNDGWPLGGLTNITTAAALATVIQGVRAKCPNAVVCYSGVPPNSGQIATLFGLSPGSNPGSQNLNNSVAAYSYNLGLLATIKANETGPWAFFDTIQGYWVNSSGATGSISGQPPTSTTAAVAAGAATVPLGSVLGLVNPYGAYPMNGYVMMNGVMVQYTGFSGNSLTGCTNVPASPQGTPVYGFNPIAKGVGYVGNVPSLSNNFGGSNSLLTQNDGGTHPTSGGTGVITTGAVTLNQTGATIPINTSLITAGSTLQATGSANYIPGTIYYQGQAITFTGVTATSITGATVASGTLNLPSGASLLVQQDSGMDYYAAVFAEFIAQAILAL